MPRLSEFFGIVISIYWGDNGPHNAPHFHARYGEFEAVFSIPGADVLAGHLPRRQRRFVEAWAEMHPDELERAWAAVIQGETPERIAPLR